MDRVPGSSLPLIRDAPDASSNVVWLLAYVDMAFPVGSVSSGDAPGTSHRGRGRVRVSPASLRPSGETREGRWIR